MQPMTQGQSKPRSTIILMPLGGARKLTWETHRLILDCYALFSERGVRFTAHRHIGDDQAQARDELLALFLHGTDFDDAIFLDDDVATDARFVEQLALIQEELVVCPYEMRNSDGGLQKNTWAVDTGGKKPTSEVREGRLMMPVLGAGLGLTRIRRGALEKMWKKYAQVSALNWTSHYDEHPGLACTGFCMPLVHEHPEGSGTMRRRPEDMSFFARARASGVQPYALLDVPVWHDARGGRTFREGCISDDKKIVNLKKRAGFELAECPDDLLGLVAVLDGEYDVFGLELDHPRVLDIGANIGAFSVWVSGRYPGCTIDAYEPAPDMAELYEKNCVLLPSATLHRVAVTGTACGQVELFAAGLNRGERSIHPVPGTHREAIGSFPTIGADELAPCDVLKIDTEGCEVEILQNYPHLKECSAVMVEWHSLEDFQWMRSHMREQGFRCMVDSARGRPNAERTLCFVRKDVMTDSGREA